MTTASTSLVSYLDIPKLVPTKLDYTKWNAWETEFIRALCIKHGAHYIGMDDGHAQRCDVMMYKRPETPILESIGNA